MTNKLAFNSLYGNSQRVPWSNFIWTTFIPPSRSFITWRFLHDKLPTDDNLRKRGCTIVSICCFCMEQAESSHHIFLECKVTANLWKWLITRTATPLDLTSCLSLILGIIGRGSSMAQLILNSAIIHIIWLIWMERNQRCFHNKIRPMTSLFNCLLAEVKISYQLVLAKGNSDMKDYNISRLFSIPL